MNSNIEENQNNTQPSLPEENIELKIKQIPLKVKTAKSPKKIKKEKSSLSSIKVFSTFKLIAVIILLLINTCLIFNIAIKKDSNNKNSYLSKEKIATKIPPSSSVLGSWKTHNEGLFSFKDDNTFYWYDSYKYKEDNYYSGTYNYKNGEEAINEMGYTEEEIKLNFGENVQIENVYSLNLMPKTVYKGGIDTTSKDLNEDESWWFLLIIKDDDTALGYNKTLDLRYNLSK